MKRFVLGITGASGSVYGQRAARAFLELGCELHLIFTETGRAVFAYETGTDPDAFAAGLAAAHPGRLFVHGARDFFAPPASGSFRSDGMLAAPCSMAAAASMAQGTGGDLLRRAADVHLKERRPLVVLARETPLSVVHLRNLLALAEAGAVVMPACPAFYSGAAKSIAADPASEIEALADGLVGRALAALGLENELYPRWNGPA